MRGFTCYAGLPRSALDAIRGDEGCFALMQALWHERGGAWAAMARHDRNELARMVEEFDLDPDGGSLVDRYTTLCASFALRDSQTDQAVLHIKGAHGLHQLLLSYHFERQGIAAAAQLASMAIRGVNATEMLGELMCLSEPTVLHIAGGLSTVDPQGLLEALPALVDSVRRTKWGRLLGSETREHSSALARDADFRREFEGLVELYARAAQFRHLVLIG